MKKQLLFITNNFLTIAICLVLFNSLTETRAQTIIWGTGAVTGVADGQFSLPFTNSNSSTYSPTAWTARSISHGNGTVTPGNAYWTRSTIGYSIGAYASTTPINSPSVTNGVAIFDSDFMDNVGVAGAFSTGIAPSSQIGDLISPRIDLTGYSNNALVVSFYCQWRDFQVNNFLVSMSVDDGVTWTDVDINTIFPSSVGVSGGWVTASFNTVTQGVMNLTNCRVRFRFDGNYYYAMVDDISISESTPALSVNTVVDSNITCNSLSDGGATAVASSGTLPYTYSWSNSATTASITGVIAGTYTVTLTDANNITAIDSVTITQPDALVAATVVDSNTTCNGYANGGATSSATGGTAPYTYSWSNSATTASITGIIAGTYSVTITDANGCSASSSSTITEPALFVASTIVDSNVTCNGFANGGATSTPTGGTIPYSYLWSNAATTASMTGIIAGTYTVTITDANGCSYTSSSTVTQPASLSFTATLANITGTNSGNIDVTVTGGTTPYSYNWSNGATTEDLSNITATGTYTLTITDNNGCSTIDSTVIYNTLDLFVSTWKTDNTGNSNSTSITIPTQTGYIYNYDVDWNGDGVFDEFGVTGDATHDYGVAGTYIVKIKGDFPSLYFSSSMDNNKILSVIQWGNQQWVSMKQAFFKCENIQISATDTPDLSLVTDMTYMFGRAKNFNDDISNWDVSSVTKMIGVFSGARAFNQSLNTWNVDSVTNMENMFNNAYAFNQSLSNWNVDSVNQMSGMFYHARAFNQDISTWNVGNVTEMEDMFYDARSFNQPLNTWDVSSVTEMHAIFREAIVFNQPLNNWDVSSVTETSAAFDGATVFNQDISSWNMSTVEYMQEMFEDAVAFNQNIGGWNVSSATTMSSMFEGATSFNQDISNWNVSSVTRMGYMFNDATAFNQDISGWNVGSVTDISRMFKGATSFDQNLGNWNVSQVTSAGSMFYDAHLSQVNYDSLLLGWASQNLQSNVSFDAGSSNFCKGDTARQNIITNFIWNISDSGQLCPPSINTMVTNVTCFGGANGIIIADVTQGTAPLTYAWSTGSSDTAIINLVAGTYSVTVTDSNNLSTISSATVMEPSIPTTITTVDTNVSCFGGSNGVATAGISQINTIYFEGFENYSGASTYSANTALLGLSGASFETSTSQGRIRIPAGASYVRTGNFSVTLDAAINGAFPDPVNYLIKTWDLSAHTANPLNIDFWMMDHGEESDVNDRVWVRGSNTDSWIEVYNLVSPNLSNGVWHNITIPRIDTIITNASQTLTSTFEVRFGQQDNFSSSSITSSDGFTFDDISITTNSVSQNSYLWSNNDTTASVTGLIAGKYMVTVTNGTGCSAVDSVTIIEPTLLTTSTVVDSNATCNGFTDGGGTASGNGGTSPYTYLWSNSATTAIVTGLTNAKHFVTVTDAKGCTAIDSLDIIVDDIVLPTVITQNINSYLDNTGNATIAPADIDNGSNDACGIQSSQLDIATFNCSNIGANTVYLIVTDMNGNSDSTTAIVTVMDTLNPMVSVQNYTAYIDASGTATIDSTNVDNGSTDNCAIQSISLSATSFTCTNIGANAVLVTVTDVNGNSDTATVTVTVSDTISPIVNTQNVTIYLDATGSASITTADINNGTTDNCSIQSLSLDSTLFDCSETGYSTVVLTATDANGNTSTNTATVTVLDTISPTVITQNHTAYLNPAGFAIITESDIDNGSFDNCSIQSLTLNQVIFNCADTGLNTVALQVTDLNGNISSANAVVTIMDTLMPTVNTQNATVYLDASGQATIVVADIDNGSFDNCSVLNMALDITSFDCSNAGSNTVVLTVTDVNGNSNTATAVVTVMDTINPIMATQDITVYLDVTGMATIQGSDIDNGSTDNCAIQSYSLDISSFNCNDLGTNTVILAATDVNGNINSASAIVTVIDSITPVITCPANFSDCGPEITIPEIITSDNCITTLTLISGIESDQTFPVGLTTNTYVVEDITGNSATCSVDITRYPQPVVTVREDTTVYFEQAVTLYSTSEFVVEWEWTPRMFLNDASSNQPICTPQHSSDYTLIGKSVDGCYSEPKTVAVTMNEAGAVLVPNTFSPNGDGYNDYFEIPGISFHPDMRITIFNRNGEVLFQETGYENNWDGTANGKTLPVATYYFILDQGNGKEPIKGDITIIK